MWILLACTPKPALTREWEPVYPVDPSFTGTFEIPGADVRYYTVVGRDDGEVMDSLRRSGPNLVGTPHGGTTSWDIRWTYVEDGACAEVAVVAHVTVTFPSWSPPDDAPRGAVGNWQRYLRALAAHEQGHVDRILPIVAAMPQILGGAGCAHVDVAGRAALDAIEQANEAYDRETDNGAIQGAQLYTPRAG